MQYAITKMTARQAMGVLEEGGLVTRQQGRGTFVTLSGVSPARGNGAPSGRPVCLLGLSRPNDTPRDPVNWQVRLLLFQGIVEMAFRLGITIETDPHSERGARTEQVVNSFRRHAGLILHDEVLPEAVLGALHGLGVPLVAINSYRDVTCASRVEVDMRGGTLMAVRHLIELGHRRIALIVGDPGRWHMRQRLGGYRDALAIHGLPYDESLVVIEPRGFREDGAAAARALLARPDRPTAIFTASDNRALGAIEAAQEMGIAVPAALSVVGFDDTEESQAASPPLTTVHNPLYETGMETVRMLHHQLASGEVNPQVRVVPMRLVIRGSSSAPATRQEG